MHIHENLRYSGLQPDENLSTSGLHLSEMQGLKPVLKRDWIT